MGRPSVVRYPTQRQESPLEPTNSLVAETGSGSSDALELPDLFGGPSRTRTLDPLIKRPAQAASLCDADTLSAQQLELWPHSS